MSKTGGKTTSIPVSRDGQPDTARALSRREVLRTGGRLAGAAATLAAVRAAFPAGVFAAAPGPEVTRATFGYIALTDSAPLIIAREKGFYAKYGLADVTVAKQASWGTTRDNLELGSGRGGIDGAHILTPMPYLMTNGNITMNNRPVPMYILARLNVNGQGISVAETHKALGVTVDASPLRAAFQAMAAARRDVKCAMTFRGGTHDLWLRYWLAAGGIDPERDVQTIVVPPPQMVANMKVGSMEAFCVGEPWNAQLINQKVGFSALTTGELWNDHPEKSFAVRADWADANPRAAKAALMAVEEAAMWCDRPENRKEMCDIIGRRAWFNVPSRDIFDRTNGTFDYGDGRVVKDSPHVMKFWRDHAAYPFRSHDLWFLTENIRWGILPPDLDAKGLIDRVNREDLWREAVKELGVPAADVPKGTSRGPETFFDGKVFDPANPAAYLTSLAIKRMSA